jgi:hypothetical protein
MPASLSFPRKRESSNPGGRRSTRGRWLLDRRVKPDDDDWSEGANGTQQHIERTCVALRRRPRLRVAHLRRQGLLACSRLSRRRAPLRRSHGRLARGDRGGAADAGDLAALEDGLNTMEEVKACRAWRKALHRCQDGRPG